MEITLFGGNNSRVSIKDYLYNQVQAIAVQIENGLRANKTEEQIKAEMLNLFKVEKLSLNSSESYVKELGGNHYENRIKEGRERNVLIKHYNYYIPFSGDSNVLKYKPDTFHGFARKADIIEDKNQKFIKTYFEAEENFQEQFNHFKAESIGSLSSNCTEANKAIDSWNMNLENEINKIYPVVKYKIDKTDDFNKRNNIR